MQISGFQNAMLWYISESNPIAVRGLPFTSPWPSQAKLSVAQRPLLPLLSNAKNSYFLRTIGRILYIWYDNNVKYHIIPLLCIYGYQKMFLWPAVLSFAVIWWAAAASAFSILRGPPLPHIYIERKGLYSQLF